MRLTVIDWMNNERIGERIHRSCEIWLHKSLQKLIEDPVNVENDPGHRDSSPPVCPALHKSAPLVICIGSRSFIINRHQSVCMTHMSHHANRRNYAAHYTWLMVSSSTLPLLRSDSVSRFTLCLVARRCCYDYCCCCWCGCIQQHPTTADYH